MNFFKKLIPRSQVADFSNSLKDISKTEADLAFSILQVHGLQFLAFINDIDQNLREPLSTIFDFGKAMSANIEKVVKSREDYSNDLMRIKSLQTRFNKLRSQKKSLEASNKSCKEVLLSKQQALVDLKAKNAAEQEINKLMEQIAQANNEYNASIVAMVKFMDFFDSEEQKYVQQILDIMVPVLDKWARSEIEMLQQTAETANEISKIADSMNFEVKDDPRLKQILEQLDADLN